MAQQSQHQIIVIKQMTQRQLWKLRRSQEISGADLLSVLQDNGIYRTGMAKLGKARQGQLNDFQRSKHKTP
jgi:hypothetical protein